MRNGLRWPQLGESECLRNHDRRASETRLNGADADDAAFTNNERATGLARARGRPGARAGHAGTVCVRVGAATLQPRRHTALGPAAVLARRGGRRGRTGAIRSNPSRKKAACAMPAPAHSHSHSASCSRQASPWNAASRCSAPASPSRPLSPARSCWPPRVTCGVGRQRRGCLVRVRRLPGRHRGGLRTCARRVRASAAGCRTILPAGVR